MGQSETYRKKFGLFRIPVTHKIDEDGRDSLAISKFISVVDLDPRGPTLFADLRELFFPPTANAIGYWVGSHYNNRTFVTPGQKFGISKWMANFLGFYAPSHGLVYRKGVLYYPIMTHTHELSEHSVAEFSRTDPDTYSWPHLTIGDNCRLAGVSDKLGNYLGDLKTYPIRL